MRELSTGQNARQLRATQYERLTPYRNASMCSRIPNGVGRCRRSVYSVTACLPYVGGAPHISYSGYISTSTVKHHYNNSTFQQKNDSLYYYLRLRQHCFYPLGHLSVTQGRGRLF